MRYKINVDKSVNDLVPFTLKGRKFILLLQSFLAPLQSINDKFVDFAKDKHIEARMTSQVMIFEWFLSYKLNKYFIDSKDKITIIGTEQLGIPVYHSPNNETFVTWKMSDRQSEKPVFYHKSEELKLQKYSFIVSCPAIQESIKDEFVYALSHWVDKYKIAGKTYIIKVST